MEWLNYHHLQYFWVVAREGSISRACEVLRLAQPTISGQLRELENSLGEKLFYRSGRGLALTEVGNVVYDYAEQIFSLGDELKDTIRSGETRRLLVIGIADVLPKLVAYRLLAPVKRIAPRISIVCREGRTAELCSDLAIHKLDVVLSDTPMTSSLRIKAYNHLLGESSLSFFGVAKLAGKYSKNFPESLRRAPLLLPTTESATRENLDRWFFELNIKPTIIGEFADTALMTMFGEEGEGIFPAPSIVSDDLVRKAGLKLIGTADSVVEKFFAISIEKRIKHSAVLAISQSAKTALFR